MDKILDKIIETVQKYKTVILIVFIISIVTLSVLFIFSVKNTIDFVSKIHSSEATIIGISTDKNSKYYTYEIEFFDKKKGTTTSEFTSNARYSLDDSFKVYYSNPNKIYLQRANPVVLLLFIINIGITILLFLIVKRLFKVDTSKKKIMDDNLVIFAYYEKVTSKQVNNKLLYNIEFSWFNNDDRKTYRFISEDLKEDPSQAINFSNKNGANVHLDRNNYDNYIIDLDEFLNNKN